MFMYEEILKFEYHKGVKRVFPSHRFVKNWLFVDGEEDEATLANAMAKVAEKNGMSVNDLMHLFPALLRMLNSDIDWANQKVRTAQTSAERADANSGSE